MPHWESVFGRHFEVPGFVQFLVSKKVLEDTSYGNDEAPSFGVFDPITEHRVILWVNHPLRSRRHDFGDRFMVQENDQIDFSSDDLEAALEDLFKKLSRFQRTLPRKGPKEWRPAGSKESQEDWQEKLTDLKDEFYARRR